MPHDPDHSTTKIGYHENAPTKTGSRSENGRKPRNASGRGRAAITDIRIAHVETTSMTATEYTDAVEALAVLIARYERRHPEEPTAA